MLRLFQDPMKNLEATGIEMERVELMEEQMKADCISELHRYGGRVLLHAEESNSDGFSIVVCYLMMIFFLTRLLMLMQHSLFGKLFLSMKLKLLLKYIVL